jgi:transposase InsO family protein
MTKDPKILNTLEADARAATTPADRGRVVAEYMDLLQCSKGYIYGFLKKRRVPPTRHSEGGIKPKHSIPDETIEKIAGQIITHVRASGQDNLIYEDALTLAENRRLIPRGSLTVDQFKYRLKELGLQKKFILAPAPTQTLYSKYPNHVHQIDWSVCLQWDFGDKGKPMKWQSWTEGLEKNKILQTTKRRSTTIWRVIVVDHYTGAFYLDYYEISGESLVVTLRALEDAWFKNQAHAGLIFHGLPDILLTDKGPGNKAQAMKNLCMNYEIQLSLHARGKPNAKGSVERAHYMVQRRFEHTLLDNPVTSIEELRERSFEWQMRHNATAIHSRHKDTRYGCWAKNIEDHLRVPASREEFRNAATRDVEERPINVRGEIRVRTGRNTETFEVPKRFRHLAKRKKLLVVFAPMRYEDHKAVLVSEDGKQWFEAHRLTKRAGGFPSNARPIHHPTRSIANATTRFVEAAKERELPKPSAVPTFTEDDEQQIRRAFRTRPAATVNPDQRIVETIEPYEARSRIVAAVPGMTTEMKIELRDSLTEDIDANKLMDLIAHYQEQVEWNNPEEHGYAAG